MCHKSIKHDIAGIKALEITQDLWPGVELLTNYNWDYRATRWLNMQKCRIQRDKKKMKMKQIGIALADARQKNVNVN